MSIPLRPLALLCLLPLAAFAVACDGDATETACHDGIDNDDDGRTDCDDPDCDGAAICQQECGDGIRDAAEECDGTDFGGETCGTIVLGTTGDLACSATCTIISSGCEDTTCGDGVLNGTEDCDDDDLGGETCLTLGHDVGVLACTTACALDEQTCWDCTDASPVVVEQTAEGATPILSSSALDWMYYSTVTLGGEEYYLDLELYGEYVAGGSVSLGPHTLGVGDDADYQTCGICVRMTHVDSEAEFFAYAGTLTLTALGSPPGGSLQASLTDAYLVEVTIDEDWHSEWVAGGQCLALADHSLDASVTEYVE